MKSLTNDAKLNLIALVKFYSKFNGKKVVLAVFGSSIG